MDILLTLVDFILHLDHHIADLIEAYGAWTYAILFVMALIDVLLYVLVGNLLQCYRCQAQYRGVAGLEGRERFHLETHERHRQQVARLKQTASGS